MVIAEVYFYFFKIRKVGWKWYEHSQYRFLSASRRFCAFRIVPASDHVNV
jgi:hypothetical protein